MLPHESMAARVARRLRDARIQARMTVREVADCLNVSHTLIVKYESGAVEPSLDRLDTLARIYGQTPAALLADLDAAMPLIATIDQASVPQLTRLVHLLGEGQDRV